MKLRWENKTGNDGTGFTGVPFNPRTGCKCRWCNAAEDRVRLYLGATQTDCLSTLVLIEGAHDARRLMLADRNAPQFDMGRLVESILERLPVAEPLAPSDVRAVAKQYGFEAWPAKQRAAHPPVIGFGVRAGWEGRGPDGMVMQLGLTGDAVRVMSATPFSVAAVYDELYALIGLAAR